MITGRPSCPRSGSCSVSLSPIKCFCVQTMFSRAVSENQVSVCSKRQNAPLPDWMTAALQVRVNFKLGFLSEIRRDTRGALKSYIKACRPSIHESCRRRSQYWFLSGYLEQLVPRFPQNKLEVSRMMFLYCHYRSVARHVLCCVRHWRS